MIEIAREGESRPAKSGAGCLPILACVLFVALIGVATWSIDSPVFWALWVVFWGIVWVVLKRIERIIWG